MVQLNEKASKTAVVITKGSFLVKGPGEEFGDSGCASCATIQIVADAYFFRNRDGQPGSNVRSG